jgi:hypothetical protein
MREKRWTRTEGKAGNANPLGAEYGIVRRCGALFEVWAKRSPNPKNRDSGMPLPPPFSTNFSRVDGAPYGTPKTPIAAFEER